MSGLMFGTKVGPQNKRIVVRPPKGQRKERCDHCREIFKDPADHFYISKLDPQLCRRCYRRWLDR